jgi:phasin family protein
MADIENTTPKADIAAKKFEKFADKATEKVMDAAVKADDAAHTAAETVATGFKDVQAKVTNTLHRAADIARGAVDVQRGALETAVKASQIYGEGLQGIATHAAEVSKLQFEDTIAYLRSLTSAKSVREAVELQTNFARNTASRYLAETSVFVEDYLKVAGDALAPVTTRAREAAEKVKKAA